MKMIPTIGLAAMMTCGFLVACSGSDGTTSVPTSESNNTESAKGGTTTPGTNADKGKGGTTGGNTTPGAKPGDKPGGKGTPSGNPGTPGTPGNPGDPPDPNDPGVPGQNGQPGRVAVNEHCCFGGKYFKCPDVNACLGGFDLDACLANCNAGDACFDDCFTKLDNAGAPKGCDANAAPPAGVDCANGNINL